MEHMQLLNKDDARSLVKRIKKAAIEAHDQIAQAGRWLIEFRDREGWKALGYDSWTHCIRKNSTPRTAEGGAFSN